MGAKEGPIEAALIRRIGFLGGKCIKLTGYKGIPDRLVILPGGKVIFVELKSPKGKISEAQVQWLHQLTVMGFTPAVINEMEAINILFPIIKEDV